MKPKTIIPFLIFLMATGVTASPPTSFTSRVEQVPVLELYTSQGCSSCPPADAWLTRLLERPGLWEAFIPIAFHVDYWDSLGWRDHFSSPRYSHRQRDYHQAGKIASVYTPGFVLGGREWRGWFRGGRPDLSPGPAIGRLQLSLDGQRNARIRFSPVDDQRFQHLSTHLAVLGFGMTTQVGRGENSGKRLHEDFVVLGYRFTDTALKRPPREWVMKLPDTASVETTRRAVVAWISVPGDPAPVQAVAGWLP